MTKIISASDVYTFITDRIPKPMYYEFKEELDAYLKMSPEDRKLFDCFVIRFSEIKNLGMSSSVELTLKLLRYAQKHCVRR